MRFLICLILLVAPVRQSAAQNSDNAVLQYVTEDYVAGVTLRPARLLQSKSLATLAEAAGDSKVLNEAMSEFQLAFGIGPRDIEQTAILLDRRTVFRLAGVPDTDDPEIPRRTATIEQLKRLALAMHEFNDIHQCFPDNDGPDTDDKGNLSWRVHLLPFLNEAALFERFHQDEPWDSEHNKSLIKEMPDIFKTSDVKGEGKTSVHGIVGENTIMSGDRAVRMRDVLDGTSNTLMLAVSGPEKADIWTKPGGLPLEDGPPTDTLGNVGYYFFMARCDGSVDAVTSVLDAETFRRFVTISDGNRVGKLPIVPAEPPRLPTWILHSRKKIDQQAVIASLQPLGNPVEVSVDSVRTHTLGDYVLAFPDDRTLLAAPQDLMPKLLGRAKASGDFGNRLRQLSALNDLAVVLNLQNLKPITNRMAGHVPMAGLLQSVKSLQISIDITGGSKYLNTVTADMETAASAAQLTALLAGLVQMQKAQLSAFANDPAGPFAADEVTALAKLYDRVVVRTEGDHVVCQMAKPEDIDSFIESLKPVAAMLFPRF